MHVIFSLSSVYEDCASCKNQSLSAKQSKIKLNIMSRRALTESEILFELHGDDSGDEFSDYEDEFDEIVNLVQQRLEGMDVIEDEEQILQQISDIGK